MIIRRQYQIETGQELLEWVTKRYPLLRGDSWCTVTSSTDGLGMDEIQQFVQSLTLEDIKIINSNFNGSNLIDKIIDRRFPGDRLHSEEFRQTQRHLHPFDCIPLPVVSFLKLNLQALSRIGKPAVELKYVDAGCGMGQKVALARMLGFDATGIELDKEMVKIANGHLYSYPKKSQVLHGDITTHDFSPYDVIYAYNPMIKLEGMVKFYENLLSTCKPDVLLILVNVDSGHQAIKQVNQTTQWEAAFRETEYQSIYEITS